MSRDTANRLKANVSPQEAELAADIASFTHDPLGYVLYNYPWGVPGTPLAKKTGPRDWQVRLLDSIGKKLRSGAITRGEVIKEATASGHGVGKSATVAWLIEWSLDTCVDARAVITANTETQLRTKTWPELTKWHSMALTRHWFSITATALISNLPGHDKTWRADAIPWSATNTEAFAGLHNEGNRILLVFDEASAIIDKVWEVAEGALTDDNTEIIWCVFGNPTRNSGRFKACFTGHKSEWTTHRVDSRTVEGTNKVQIAKWIALYGEDSDFVRVRVRGMFPRAGSTQLISSDEVLSAQNREPGDVSRYARILAVDVARHGTDQTVIARRQGRKVGRIFRYRIPNTMQVAAKVAEHINAWKPDHVFVDATGMGWGVVDRLHELGYRMVIAVQTGERADDPARFKNKRVELWVRTKEFIENGGCLPDDPELEHDLTTPEYGFDGSMRYVLESKEDMKDRGEGSPDSGDALALTFAAPVAAVARSTQSLRDRLRKRPTGSAMTS